VPIAKKALPYFQIWLHKNDCKYLISTPNGNHMEYRNYYDSYWKPQMKVLGIEKHRSHDTRHKSANLLTAAKVDERYIQKIVGHKDQNVTRVVFTTLEIME